MDWDVLFVFVVGSYNTKGNLAEMAEACIDWQTRHLVGDGLQLGGGVTKHYEGSGDRSRVFWCFQNHSRFCHFHQYTRNTKASGALWMGRITIKFIHMSDIY